MLDVVGKPDALGAMFAQPDVTVERRSDGSFILSSNTTAVQTSATVGAWLEHWARATPDNVFVAQRDQAGAPWRRVTYRQAWASVLSIATALSQRDLSPERPLAVLSDNSIEVLLLSLAAIQIGVPVVSITSAYSLVATDYAKLEAMIALSTPGLIYADDGPRYAKALAAIDPHGPHEVVSLHNTRSGDTAFQDLCVPADEARVRARMTTVGPDTITRILFTSGSTGTPKGVINTQRMNTTMADARTQLWPVLERMPPVIVDWLPWSHTFGANHNLFLIMRNGGAMYIDAGRPAPGLMDTTLANIRDVRPNIFLNVPRGFDMLVDVMDADKEFRRQFFMSVKIMFYAGAALGIKTWTRLQEHSIAAVGTMTPTLTAWGSTETSPVATDCHYMAETNGNIGVPIPGCQIKLLPRGDKIEARIKGPNVTPGYFRSPELTAEAFDEEGFYKIGDALRLADDSDPNRGMIFDGRIGEDFKLLTGTWVNVATVKARAVAALAPLAQEVVVAGHDADHIGFLIFPNLAACQALSGLPETATRAQILAAPTVVARVREAMQALRAQGGGSSSYAAAALLLIEPPSINDGEITDKGYINQRRVQTCRADLVAALMSASPAPGRITL
ncbi:MULTISPECIES: feruloyl-CoA synthase [unclassified Beijerinckia]|uniref:feruloyl-CoA synthase n=1 Tax=unclassified Beijerinckia TaxID=2638183 RepID=UPI000898AD41|nr:MULTISPECIES: feruloyl-CoA synthase [unclassified Beijerinckia]MDH7799032.1 feruloyl-CoA synthase [Beijerinckia sp. GAS462]SED97255.1 trans-feruloyl-CoA synthase [Beijerinckia sp. 28-YEA-48]